MSPQCIGFPLSEIGMVWGLMLDAEMASGTSSLALRALRPMHLTLKITSDIIKRVYVMMTMFSKDSVQGMVGFEALIWIA